MRATTCLLALLAVSVSACSTTGDQAAMLLDSAQACERVCTSHPDVAHIGYKAGGGLPLLFIGTVEGQCSCR